MSMSMLIALVNKIAIQTREKFETGEINRDELKVLYEQYNPIDDVDLFITRASKLFPKLNCGLGYGILKSFIFGG